MLLPATPLPGTGPAADPTGRRIGVSTLPTRAAPGRRCEAVRTDGPGLVDTRPMRTPSEGRWGGRPATTRRNARCA